MMQQLEHCRNYPHYDTITLLTLCEGNPPISSGFFTQSSTNGKQPMDFPCNYTKFDALFVTSENMLN